jgi:hypothetical protein
MYNKFTTINPQCMLAFEKESANDITIYIRLLLDQNNCYLTKKALTDQHHTVFRSTARPRDIFAPLSFFCT